MNTKITLRTVRNTCSSVPGSMKGIILSIPGVEDVYVHYEEQTLDITFDDKRVTVQKIVEKVAHELGILLEEGEKTSNTVTS